MTVSQREVFLNLVSDSSSSRAYCCFMSANARDVPL